MTPCYTYIKKPESHYSSLLDMYGIFGQPTVRLDS